MVGRATLTTDSSMKEMVEPRMVAASTQNLLVAAQSGAARTDWIAPSSQGRALGLITVYRDFRENSAIRAVVSGSRKLATVMSVSISMARRRSTAATWLSARFIARSERCESEQLVGHSVRLRHQPASGTTRQATPFSSNVLAS